MQLFITKKVNEIEYLPYGDNEMNISCDPNDTDIENAVIENNFETRSFQGDLMDLEIEWKQKTSNGHNRHNLIKEYHSKRIAYFVINGWKEPITLYKNSLKIKDGLHRLRAAKYLNKEFIITIYE